MNAYILSHNGLGDNLYMIGAVLYLLNYYHTIYFICKDIYYDNVQLFYKNNKNVVLIKIDSKHERESCKKVLDYRNDILICGLHKQFFKTKITNTKLLERIQTKNKYTIDYDTINSNNYKFIEQFYKDIHLDLNIFFDYFQLPVNVESQHYYNTLSKYNHIVFIHSKASDKKLDITSILERNLFKENTIIICANENVYERNTEKYNLCKTMVQLPILYYLDILQNSNEIYIIDSCFVGFVLPLLKTNKLKANVVRIIERNTQL